MSADYESEGFKSLPEHAQHETIRLDGGTIAELHLILHLLTTRRRVGTANSDVNAMRYTAVHDVMRKHGEAMRAELRTMGWRV